MLQPRVSCFPCKNPRGFLGRRHIGQSQASSSSRVIQRCSHSTHSRSRRTQDSAHELSVSTTRERGWRQLGQRIDTSGPPIAKEARPAGRRPEVRTDGAARVRAKNTPGAGSGTRPNVRRADNREPGPTHTRYQSVRSALQEARSQVERSAASHPANRRVLLKGTSPIAGGNLPQTADPVQHCTAVHKARKSQETTRCGSRRRSTYHILYQRIPRKIPRAAREPAERFKIGRDAAWASMARNTKPAPTTSPWRASRRVPGRPADRTPRAQYRTHSPVVKLGAFPI